MITRRLLRPAAAQVQSRRQMSKQAPSPIYTYLLKSNVTYVTFILVGAAIGGGAYNAAMDFIFKSYNRGRMYDQIDWSKWESKWKAEE